MEAEKWWNSKIPLERYRAFGQSELPPEFGLTIAEGSKPEQANKIDQLIFDFLTASPGKSGPQMVSAVFARKPEREGITRLEFIRREKFLIETGALIESSTPLHNQRLPTMLVGWGIIGQDVAAVSPYDQWRDIPENYRTIILNWMQKGWVDFGDTAIGLPV